MRAAPTVGSASPPVHAAAASATRTASARPSLSMNRPPWARCTQEISESARNLLAWRSSALSTSSTAAMAGQAFSGGQTASRAVVPSALRCATATVVSPVSTGRQVDAETSAGAVVMVTAP